MKNILLLSLFTLFFVSCGGGTTGSSSTGEFKSVTVQGSLINELGEPIRNIEVGVLETDASTITDSEGGFMLSPVVSSTLTLSVHLQGGEVEIPLDTSDENETMITIDAIINNAERKVVQQSTLRGQIVVGGECASLSTLSGSQITISPRVLPLSCDVKYIFKGARTTLERVALSFDRGTCSKVTASTYGQELSGNTLTIFQSMEIGRGNRSCRARTTTTSEGVKSLPRFEFSIKNVGSNSSNNLSEAYSGTLREIGPIDDFMSCSKFTESRLKVKYVVKDSQITASISPESLTLVGRVGAARQSGGEYAVEKRTLTPDGGSEKIVVFPVEALGAKSVQFRVFYSYTNGDSNCTRGYQGALSQ